MKSPLEQNYYELLEVPRDATIAEIDRAYDRARAYYGTGSVAVYTLASPDDLKRVQDRTDEAYLILADEKARAEYDARIGPPGPDERPLHRDVRLAREKDEAKKEAERQEKAAEAKAEPPPPEPPPPEVKPEPPPEAKAEPAPEPPKAVEAPEPAPLKQPEPPKPEPELKVAREPTPTLPVPAVTPTKPMPAVTPAKPMVAVTPSKPMAAVDGPIPPPQMAFPEPTPKNAPAARKDSKPPIEVPKSAAKPDVPSDATFTGELLKRLRESQGLSLLEIADRTKIGRSHLENIESDKFGALPAQVYLRGFLMSLARELRLDPLRVSKSYLEQMAQKKPAGKPGR